MRYFEKIKGESVYLSPINADDYEIYTKWMNEKTVTENLGKHSRMTTLQGEKEWLEKNNGEYNLAIVLKNENRLIGNISLKIVSVISLHQILQQGWEYISTML